jgi:AcrR family transcriptional regulator
MIFAKFSRAPSAFGRTTVAEVDIDDTPCSDHYKISYCSTYYKTIVTLRAERRSAILQLMADHVLAHGLGGATLRRLAKSAGTSDRMLLYYFVDKDEILGDLFACIAQRFALLLMASLPIASPLKFNQLRSEMWRVFRAPAARPFVRVYLELCIAAAHGEQPHGKVAAGIARASLGWVGSMLEVAEEAERAPQAALLLASIDGLWLLDAVGLGSLADQVAETVPEGLRG